MLIEVSLELPVLRVKMSIYRRDLHHISIRCPPSNCSWRKVLAGRRLQSMHVDSGNKEKQTLMTRIFL
jgi:hypothetical protein